MTLAWPVEKSGSTGEPVRSIQYLLRSRGRSVTVDGVYGPQTESAVRVFQSGKGLTPDGVTGERTWPALVLTVREGSSGDAVRAVQSQARYRDLRGDPTAQLAIDGIFGQRTAEWVRGFQEAVRVTDTTVTVDGVVGPVTWSALVRELLAG